MHASHEPRADPSPKSRIKVLAGRMTSDPVEELRHRFSHSPFFMPEPETHVEQACFRHGRHHKQLQNAVIVDAVRVQRHVDGTSFGRK